MSTSPLDGLFNPRSIAVIGASSNEAKIGHFILRNIIRNGYKGALYPVNNKEKCILGMKAYPSVADVPGDVDLAVIVIPAQFVAGVLEECGKKGVRFAVIITSGFKEIGNREGEAALIAIAKKHGMRILGPNVFGLYSMSSSLNCTFGPSLVEKGSIGLITQSGALGIALMGRTAEERLGLSCIISVGNKADISEAELVQHLGQDPATKAILIYIEGTKSGRALMDAAREVVPKKPVVVIKAGSSVRGSRAAASHTGSLAGSDAVFDAAFRQCGILRAQDIDEAFHWVRVLSTQPLPRGDGTVIITNGGGIGVMATDECERRGVALLNAPAYTAEMFKGCMPAFGSAANPVDLTGQATDVDYERALSLALNDKGKIDAVVGLFCETATTDADALGRRLINLMRNDQSGKPVVFSFVGGKAINRTSDMLNAAGYPVYMTPEGAISALAALYCRKKFTEAPPEEPCRPTFDAKAIRKALGSARLAGRTQLIEPEVRAIIQAMGLEMPKTRLCKTAAECQAAAKEIGYPVVMKVVSSQIIHKTEAGGVMLDIGDSLEVAIAYEAITASCRQRYPTARIDGITVSEMVKGGSETIVGATRDPSFGPVIMFGFGGIYVEVLKDVAFRVAPATEGMARQMIGELRSAPMLFGARGERPKDVDRAIEAICSLSHLVEHFPEILEMDLNPLIVMERGMGCKVLDSRITLRGDDENG
ncbi:MAG: acetate--CoA ligase family protein [Euryarchaeota archaeon]|nr:acetate--CoA ligase family protein [Euryarchaeota archaeon]